MARQKSNVGSLESLASSLARGQVSPLYLLTGEEEFLTEECLDLVLEHSLDEASRSFNLDITYGGDVDARDVVTLASSFPMMAERRVVVVRDAEKLTTSEANRDILMRYLHQPLSSTVLVFVTAKADMRLSVFKVFQQKGVVVESKAFFEKEILEWLERRFRKFGRSISPEAIELLQAHVGNSLRELQNEIDKLLLYIGDRTHIDVEDVSAVVGMSKSYNVFELQRAIISGDAPRSIEIVVRMLDAGENPLGIVVMLTRYFQKLWILPSARRRSDSDYDLASQLQVRPFFLKEYLSASNRFPVEHVERSFAALLEADIALKTTQDDPRTIMTTLLYRLLNREAANPLAEAL